MEILRIAIQVIGGLGIFLLGMRNMSDGLQTVAGPSLRRLIGMATNNRFLAVGVGVTVTCLVQSSSVTTVMAVGFVNSGLMALHQAMGIVLGANIGTTITGWILVLKIGKYGLALLGVGSFPFLFSKNEKVKYISLAVLGIGMVFFGLELMKDGFKPLADDPAFLEWFHAFDASTYVGVLQCALVGCVLTLIVQSSSATLGITIGLVSTGVLKFETGAALVLGENIGTTITAFLASLGTTTNARRSAYFHILFNLLGVLWITAIFSWLYLPLIKWVLLTFLGIEDISAGVTENGAVSYPHAETGIATVHTVFNVVNVVVFFPLTVRIATQLEKYVKDKPKRERRHLTHLEYQLFDSPFAAVMQSRYEVGKMGKHTRIMLDDLRRYVEDREANAPLAKKLFDQEDILDIVQKEITTFLTEALSGPMAHDLAEESKQQLRLADEFETVSDYVTQLLRLDLRLTNGGLDLTPEQREEIAGLHRLVCELFDLVLQSEADVNLAAVCEEARVIGDKVTELARELRSRHWDRLSQEQIAPLISTMYADTVQSYRKIRSHLVNVAESRAGYK